MEFDDLGLKAAFERLITVINENKQYEIDFCVEDVSCEKIVLLTVYRVVQECLTNIVKHANATKIIFHAKYSNGKYNILIEDNGDGFSCDEAEQKKANHFGLSSMKERIYILKGTITINSCSDGTKVEIEIPMKKV